MNLCGFHAIVCREVLDAPEATGPRYLLAARGPCAWRLGRGGYKYKEDREAPDEAHVARHVPRVYRNHNHRKVEAHAEARDARAQDRHFDTRAGRVGVGVGQAHRSTRAGCSRDQAALKGSNRGGRGGQEDLTS